MGDVPNEAPTSGAVVATGAGVGKAANAGKMLSSLGGVLGAVAAWSCCIVPLTLFSVGVSGMWIGNLTALAPYQPIFIGIAVVSLGTGFYLVYRKPKTVDCAPGSYCAGPGSDKLTKSALWLSSVLVVLAVAFNYLAPILLVV
jgi:mercuric ion transport protein